MSSRSLKQTAIITLTRKQSTLHGLSVMWVNTEIIYKLYRSDDVQLVVQICWHLRTAMSYDVLHHLANPIAVKHEWVR